MKIKKESLVAIFHFKTWNIGTALAEKEPTWTSAPPSYYSSKLLEKSKWYI